MIRTRLIFRWIGCALITVMCVAGVLQFHHHDCNGDACIALSVNDIDLSGWRSIEGCHSAHRHHSSQRDNHSHSCNDDCGLHISGSVCAKVSAATQLISTFIQHLHHSFCADILANDRHFSAIGCVAQANGSGVALPRKITFPTIDNRGSPF